jgi:hypothetical protein
MPLAICSGAAIQHGKQGAKDFRPTDWRNALSSEQRQKADSVTVCMLQGSADPSAPRSLILSLVV